MPLPTPITISQAKEALKQRLSGWASPRGGQVFVLANQRHLWEALTQLPDPSQLSPRIMVLYEGENLMRQDEPDCHRVVRDWQVIVVRGRGFKQVLEGDGLAGGGYEDFTDSLETVRDLIRTMSGISDFEAVPSVLYKGVVPVSSLLKSPEANAFMDGYGIKFSTLNDIPAIVEDAPGTEQLTGDELPP